MDLISKGGVIVLVAIIFAETGLLIGFFLPGDSLLIAAGVVAAKSDHFYLNIWFLTFALMAAAIIGDQVGFWLGTKTGPKIFNREDSLFFKKKYALEAHAFYEHHGGKAIILARFVPILRTFVPFIAGVAQMSYRKFVFFNILGGIFWIISLLWIGYFIGQTPLADKLHYIIVIVVAVSLLPIAIGVLKRFIQNSRTKPN